MTAIKKILRLERDSQAIMMAQNNLEFMRPLKNGSMKLIVTSPPYNIGKSYEKRTSLEKYVQDQAQVISECVRLLDDDGSICWQVGNHVQNGEIFLRCCTLPCFQRPWIKAKK